MKLIKKLWIPIVILITFSCLFLLFNYFNSPANNSKKSVLFTIQTGESVKSVAERLRIEGIIRSDLFFTTLIRVSSKAETIKSGQYNLNNRMKNTEILRILSKGIVATERFTVPEGLHIRQISELLEKNNILKAQDFVDACYNKEILEKYGIPFKSAEGFLFPDTYIVANDLSANQIVEVMIDKFFSSLYTIPYNNYSVDDLRRVVIIASLVEKEAKIDDERQLIAAVFYNRLQKGKRLESCSTIQYILGKTKERLLYSDLQVDSPYNTYLHSGLPPGPISNPGLKSLIAAVYPADVDYLFFVSKRDGSHHFSTTYQQHLKAIEKYGTSGRVGHQIS